MNNKIENLKASIIVRTKNEDRWIGQCLSAIEKQSYENKEVILVDNNSTDETINIASSFKDVKIVKYSPKGIFKPGESINLGIKASTGDYIVIISGHCIPTNKKWLSNLLRNLKDKNIAGVYGRQEPLSFTSSLDKRDLVITFGLDKKIQKKDPFFHNANSALRRDTWEKIPFDEKCTNIEDRIWGKEVIARGYKIIYEPDASVFHHHGIHHGLNEERANSIVRILDSISVKNKINKNIKKIKSAAFIPIKGELINYEGKYLLENTINTIKNISLIKEIVISTDNKETAKIAKRLGASKIIMRPESLSKEYVGVSDVIKYTLEQYEKKFSTLDLIIFLEETYPLRDKNEITTMIQTLIDQGNDSLIGVHNESRGAWIVEDNKVTPVIEQKFMPRNLKSKSLDIAQIGYCSVLRPEFIRFGDVLGPDVALYKIQKKIHCTEIKNNNDMKDYLDLLVKNESN